MITPGMYLSGICLKGETMLDRSALVDEKVLHDVGTLWVMHQGQQRARCALMSRADVWELHLIIDGRPLQVERCRRGKPIFDLAEAWKQRMRDEGWHQIVPRTYATAAKETIPHDLYASPAA
jgi:hypothetical protein